MSKISIIGVGNILFKDEGIGIYLSSFLDKNYSFEPEIEIIDGGVLGFKLMTYFQERDNIILIDTISIDDEFGSIYSLPADELLGLGTYRKTAHEVEVVEMLEICSLLDKIAKVQIVGVIPADIISVEIDLTKELKDVFENIVDAVLKELEKIGVNYKKINNISLEKIIDSYSNRREEN